MRRRFLLFLVLIALGATALHSKTASSNTDVRRVAGFVDGTPKRSPIRSNAIAPDRPARQLAVASAVPGVPQEQAPIEDELVIQTPISEFIVDAVFKEFVRYAKERWNVNVRTRALPCASACGRRTLRATSPSYS